MAKLDRLSRSVAFIAEKMERGLCFVVVDMPSAAELWVGLSLPRLNGRIRERHIALERERLQARGQYRPAMEDYLQRVQADDNFTFPERKFPDEAQATWLNPSRR